MVGAVHVSTPHDIIYNTVEESITRTVVQDNQFAATPDTPITDSETGLVPGIVYETDTPNPVTTNSGF